MAQRIYLITQGAEEKLVRASSQAVARSHVAKSTISVQVAATDDVFRLAKAGAQVEETTAESVQLELGEAPPADNSEANNEAQKDAQ